jgi:hypothetical protein
MSRTILYHVTFAANDTKRMLQARNCEFNIATVRGIEDPKTVTAYHMDHITGMHMVPDYAAIRAAIPYNHRKAYDRALTWWFPAINSQLTGIMDRKNACSRTLYDRKGKLLGTLYATPYLYDR